MGLFQKHCFGRFLIFALTGVVLLAIVACQKSGSSDPAVQTPVARVGEQDISWDAVQQSFFLEPRWGKGLTRREAYANQLGYLIEQKLFSHSAISAGLDKTPGMEARLTFILENEMIKALYRDRVEEQVEISDHELREAYRRANMRLKLAYAASPDAARALRYRDFLSKSTIDSLTLIHPADQKGLTPLFSFGDMDEALETVAFNLKMNEVGGPVQLEGEFWVLKLIGGDRDLVTFEADYQQRKASLRKVIFERRAHQLSEAFIAGLMKDKKVRLNPDTFTPLAQLFNQIVQVKEGENAIPVNLTGGEIRQLDEEIRDLANQPLVSFDGESISVAEFIRYLEIMPGDLRPRVRMAPELKIAVARMVRNRYLVDLATENNYENHPEVRQAWADQRDELLSRAYLKLLREKVSYRPGELDSFAQSPAGASLVQQFGERMNREMLGNALMDVKFRRYRLSRADSLAVLFPVEIDTLALEGRISDPDEVLEADPVRMVFREKFN